MTRHVLSVLVTNRPGVLTRVSGLFARRGYNIESLTVSPTDDPSESRMTIGVNVVSAQALEQLSNSSTNSSRFTKSSSWSRARSPVSSSS